jgi:hypothetical protein
MSEQPKMLDQKTFDRVAREWDRRVRAKEHFTIDAEPVLAADGNERDIVIVRNANPGRGWTSQLITDSEMDNDIKPPKTPNAPKQLRK